MKGSNRNLTMLANIKKARQWKNNKAIKLRATIFPQ